MPMFAKLLSSALFLLALSGCHSQVDIPWVPYSEAALEEAKLAGKPVMIDFFAEWCAPCHMLEEKTYSDSRVLSALEPFVMMKFDATSVDDPEVEQVLLDYEIPGLPVIVFLNASGSEELEMRISGFIDPDEFLEHLAAF